MWRVENVAQSVCKFRKISQFESGVGIVSQWKSGVGKDKQLEDWNGTLVAVHQQFKQSTRSGKERLHDEKNFGRDNLYGEVFG